MAVPTVSVIVTTCDRPTLLADALGDVAAQTLPPLEVRVADDGANSSADTLPPVALLELTWIEARAGQPGGARNAAARGARGEVLALLDDDDRWFPGHLAGLAAAFTDPAVLFAWRDSRVVRERLGDPGGREAIAAIEMAHDWDDALMRVNDYLPPSAWGIRRSFFERLGGFDPSFRFSEDWDFLLRARALTTPRRAPGVTVEVRLRDSGNASTDFGPERRDCLRRLRERHGLPELEMRTFWEVAHAMIGPA